MSELRSVHCLAIAKQVAANLEEDLGADLKFRQVGHIPGILLPIEERTGGVDLQGYLPSVSVFVYLASNDPLEMGSVCYEQVYSIELDVLTRWDIRDAASWGDGMETAERVASSFAMHEQLTDNGELLDDSETVTLGSGCAQWVHTVRCVDFNSEHKLLHWQVSGTCGVAEVIPVAVP